MTSNLRTGGQILVDALRVHGVDTAFCVPGESFLATLDALHDAVDQIRLIVCRQESGATNMADAYGKLTGRPGIGFVTRGPGATNASSGIHTAYQNSTPVILFIGQIARPMMEREAFQEIDFRRMYGEMSKWVAQIDDPARIPEMVSRAFHMAVSGRPGPVVLALPEDMQLERAEAEDGERYQEIQANPGAGDLETMRAMVAGAERPLLLIGGSGWTEQACGDIQSFAEAFGLPVAVSFRRQDLFDNAHPNYIGVAGVGISPALKELIAETDLILCVGPQLGEIVTQGYTMFDFPRPRQKLVHVSAGVGELGKVYQPALAINSGMPQFAAAAARLAPVDGAVWADFVKRGRAAHEAFSAPVPASAGALNMSEVMHWLDDNLPDDAIISSGAGNYTLWVHRFLTHRRFRTQLAPQSGSMGYGVPAGVCAGLMHPDRTVVSVSGDGCFLMNGQEFATAVQYGLGVVFLVVNNSMYGTIRMHQERNYPGRVSGTGLHNPDFAALARAYGGHGEVVDKTEDFAAAFERCRAVDGPSLIELRVDPEAILPANTLTALRQAAGG